MCGVHALWRGQKFQRAGYEMVCLLAAEVMLALPLKAVRPKTSPRRAATQVPGWQLYPCVLVGFRVPCSSMRCCLREFKYVPSTCWAVQDTVGCDVH